MVNRIRLFKHQIRIFFKFFSFFSKTKRVTGRLLDIKRSVLKRGIHQCKVQRNTILSKRAMVNRIPKFKHQEFF
jgi:hypothetical protein